MTSWELAKGLFLKDLLDIGAAAGVIGLLLLLALVAALFNRKGR